MECLVKATYKFIVGNVLGDPANPFSELWKAYFYKKGTPNVGFGDELILRHIELAY